MKMNSSIRLLTLTAVGVTLATLGVSHARADTSTSTYTFPTTSVYSGSTNNLSVPKTFSATIDDFNPALGMLTGVAFTYSYDFTTAYSGTTGGGGALSGTFTLAGTQVKVGGLVQYAGASFGGAGTGTGTASATSAAPIDPDNGVSEVTGSGTYAFVWSTTLNYSGSPGENLNGITLTPASSVTATYTYTPAAAPEPSTWAMLSVGAVGMAFALRRRGRA